MVRRLFSRTLRTVAIELGELDGFGQVVVRAFPHAFQGGVQVGHRGEHDDGQIRKIRFQLRQQVHAAAVRQTDVKDDQGHGMALHGLLEFHGGAGGNGRQSLVLEKFLQQGDDFGIIVNDENDLPVVQEFTRRDRGKKRDRVVRIGHVGIYFLHH